MLYMKGFPSVEGMSVGGAGVCRSTQSSFNNAPVTDIHQATISWGLLPGP